MSPHASTTGVPPVTRAGWWPPAEMWGFLAGAAAMFATMYSTQAILPEISADFGVSPSRAGLSVSVLVLALIPGAWLWGPLSERIGRRSALFLSSALLVPLTIAVPLSPGLEWLLVLRACQGVAMAGLLAVGVPYITEAFLPRFGARVMGWYTSALILGGLVGRLGVALAATIVGWRGALALVAVMPVAATLLMRRRLPAVPARESRTRDAADPGGWDPCLVGALLVGPPLFFAFVGNFTYIRFRLEAAPFELPPAVTGLVFVMWLLGAVAPVAGRLVERFGWRAVSAGAMAVSVAGIAVGLPDVLPLAILGLVLLTVGMFLGTVAAQVALGSVTHISLGTASAVYYSLYYGAGSLGAFGPGVAWESHGWVGPATLTAGVLLVGLAGLGLVARRAPTPVGPAAAGEAAG